MAVKKSPKKAAPKTSAVKTRKTPAIQKKFTKTEILNEISVLQTEYEMMFRTVLEAGIASGVFRKQNISVALRSFLMMLHAPIYWYEPRTDENEKDIADQLALMALKAVCA